MYRDSSYGYVILSQKVTQSNRNRESTSRLVRRMVADNAMRHGYRVPSAKALNKESLIGYNTDEMLLCLAEVITSRSIT